MAEPERTFRSVGRGDCFGHHPRRLCWPMRCDQCKPTSVDYSV